MCQLAGCFFLAGVALIDPSQIYWATNAIDLLTAGLFEAAAPLTTAAREERFELLQ